MGQSQRLLKPFSKLAASSLLTGLLACWSMDEASNGSVSTPRLDSSGRGNTLLDDTNTTQSDTGLLGNAASTSVDMGLIHHNSPDMTIGAADFTISTWIKQAGSIAAGIVFGKTQNQWTNMEWLIYAHTNAQGFWFNVTDAVGNDKKAVGNITRSPDVWYHVVGYHNFTTHKIGLIINNNKMTEVSIDAGGCKPSIYKLWVGRGDNLALIDETGLWRRLLTDAEVTSLYNGGAGLGWPFGGTAKLWSYTPNSVAKNFVFEGDSLTYGVSMGATENYPSQLINLFAPTLYQYTNSGTPGAYTSEMDADYASVIAPAYQAGIPNYYILWGGTNDCIHNELIADAATIYTSLSSCIAKAKATGFSVIVLTILPGSATWMTSDQISHYEARRLALNTLIRNGGGAGGYTVADIASNATIGNSGAEANVLYFLDRLHLVPNGYAIVASTVNSVLS